MKHETKIINYEKKLIPLTNEENKSYQFNTNEERTRKH